MANNLFRKSKYSLVIYDVNNKSIEEFASINQTSLSSSKSIVKASSPSDVAKKSNVIITMLPSSVEVEKVYLNDGDDESLVNSIDKNSFLIDSSTIDQSVSKYVAKQIINKGATAVDAPVSGVGAEAATLTFMVGASTSKDFEKAKSYLSFMGTGQIAKMCNNMLLAISMIGTAEAMNLGIRLGMDAKLLASIINTSSGRCWSSDTYNPCPGIMENVPSSRDYQGGFGNKLMAKDLRLAVNAANDTRSTIVLGALVQQIYNQLSTNKDFENKDFSSIYKWLNNK
ncbi:4088_t:CDS:2 [Entrophospora sp. SA101]|nr:4088_t:CDS:2 [Entrophospora sp. SA101]CAJ0897384.1 1068_t:CDS:2 [Entrophospora sp. SA101]